MELRPPDGLEVSRVGLPSDEFLLFEWRVPRVSPPPQLTPAEADVALLVFRGLSNQEIARRRGRSARTVANQLANIFRKLGVASRHELSALLARSGRGA